MVNLSDSSLDGNKKWLAVTDEENWQKCLEHGLWGASEKRSGGLKKMKVGDEMLVYIKVMRIAGIYRVTKEHFYDTTRIWKNSGGIFPHRIAFESTDRVLDSPISVKALYDRELKTKEGIS